MLCICSVCLVHPGTAFFKSILLWQVSHLYVDFLAVTKWRIQNEKLLLFMTLSGTQLLQFFQNLFVTTT